MSFAIFVGALLVSLLLDRQRKRHRFETRQEFDRQNRPAPRFEPRIPKLEAWLNVLMGAYLAGFGLFALWLFLQMPDSLHLKGTENVVAVFIGSGIALMLVGIKAVRQTRQFESWRSLDGAGRSTLG